MAVADSLKGSGLSLDELHAIPYFATLGDETLARLSRLARERAFERGELIIFEGDTCEGLFYIKSGHVKIFKTSEEGKEQVLRLMRAGDSFNEVPVFDGGANPASVEAMVPSIVYIFSRADLVSLTLSSPEFALQVIKVLAMRTRELVGLVEDLSFRRVTGRVAKILLQHAQRVAEAQREGAPVPRLTQQQIATMAGTAREMVGRSLKALEQQGSIRMERGRIIICNPATLDSAV